MLPINRLNCNDYIITSFVTFVNMGIKLLNNFLRSKVPHVFKTTEISNLNSKRVGVDISLYMCKYKAKYGDEWLRYITSMFLYMIDQGIKILIVFDGEAPPEKQKERDRRTNRKKKQQLKIDELENILVNYRVTKEVPDNIKDILRTKNELSPENTESVIENKINRLKGYLFTITSDDFVQIKDMCSRMKIPSITASMEAEGLCSVMCKKGFVDYVMTEDTDAYAYGSARLCNKLDMIHGTIGTVELDDILQGLDMSYDSFLDFCIMCGTDFNPNLELIATQRSFKFISQYKMIDNLPKHIDPTPLNHKRSRAIFSCYNADVYDEEEKLFTDESYQFDRRAIYKFVTPFYVVRCDPVEKRLVHL